MSKSIRIQVTDTPNPRVWYHVGEIYDVDPISKPITRTGAKTVQAYYLIENEANRKMHKRHVHNGMCIGADCCVVLGGNNKSFKSLLAQE